MREALLARIQIDRRNPLTRLQQRYRDVDGGRRFARPALFISDDDDMRRLVRPNIRLDQHDAIPCTQHPLFCGAFGQGAIVAIARSSLTAWPPGNGFASVPAPCQRAHTRKLDGRKASHRQNSRARCAKRSRSLRRGGRKVALVPTMGALHDGILRWCGRPSGAPTRVVVSIFVNPKQFAPTEDFGSYPRDLEARSCGARRSLESI